jgi:hydrogenase nickel incorporation protein HypA/HybF
MHELWLCKNILDIVKQKATENNYQRVTKVYLEIGQLVAIDESALLFSFNVITQGTIAENAELKIIKIPGKAFCETCRQTIYIKQYFDSCQSCKNSVLTIIKGEEMRVKSMEAKNV